MTKRILIRGLTAVLIIGMVGCVADKKVRETQPVKEAPVHQGKWSEPVNGLRARLVSKKAEYRRDEDLHLRLEIQNVSKEITSIEEPDFLPIISRPEYHGYGKNHGYGTIVTAQPIDAQHRLWISWCSMVSMPRHRPPVCLPPDGVLSVKVTAISGRKNALLQDKLMTAKKVQTEGDLPRHVTISRTLPWIYADIPGRYKLRASYDYSVAKGGWAVVRSGKGVRKWKGGKINMPSIEITVIK